MNDPDIVNDRLAKIVSLFTMDGADDEFIIEGTGQVVIPASVNAAVFEETILRGEKGWSSVITGLVLLLGSVSVLAGLAVNRSKKATPAPGEESYSTHEGSESMTSFANPRRTAASPSYGPDGLRVPTTQEGERPITPALVVDKQNASDLSHSSQRLCSRMVEFEKLYSINNTSQRNQDVFEQTRKLARDAKLIRAAMHKEGLSTNDNDALTVATLRHTTEMIIQSRRHDESQWYYYDSQQRLVDREIGQRRHQEKMSAIQQDKLGLAKLMNARNSALQTVSMSAKIGLGTIVLIKPFFIFYRFLVDSKDYPVSGWVHLAVQLVNAGASTVFMFQDQCPLIKCLSLQMCSTACSATEDRVSTGALYTFYSLLPSISVGASTSWTWACLAQIFGFLVSLTVLNMTFSLFKFLPPFIHSIISTGAFAIVLSRLLVENISWTLVALQVTITSTYACFLQYQFWRYRRARLEDGFRTVQSVDAVVARFEDWAFCALWTPVIVLACGMGQLAVESGQLAISIPALRL
ncbi:predicted protein [Phaeodactylum tricornutum CCAP 1055/1]|jgi:hypothetical protein|uniref:Uncharacterized protein n=1 Tax=Phaeodactylum tricornutum (strain CCAP 1055/1) TaxID=556484 RepID=B7GDM9_PHATC|nr:predicted protein [Phaeodactylum tricornutum CCAP 1055/1]EEC43373.1 predicted protein [Phaeodactylum tricornutum CCAP 1055/1]|eukprot:XP_002185241.1 predicted protein [Phaeodactylum tricornutum CCAP 1055/1]